MKAALTLSCCAALCLPATALAWSPLRAENPSVKKGNVLMAEEQYADAVQAYDEAARELPDARGVQLNRGLALLSQDLTEASKEAFEAAADPSAPPEVRADAYYNLGIAHAREGNALSEQEDFQGASTHFREAANAFKRSLRTRPGNRNAAWNLEYALNRIREEEEKREQQEQSQEQEQNQEQDQEQNQEQNQEQEQSQEQEQDRNQGQEQDQEQNQEQDQDQEQNQEQEQSQEQENESESGNENESQSESEPPSMQPSEVKRFLDALEQNEESLPLERARRRGAGRRPPEKDW